MLFVLNYACREPLGLRWRILAHLPQLHTPLPAEESFQINVTGPQTARLFTGTPHCTQQFRPTAKQAHSGVSFHLSVVRKRGHDQARPQHLGTKAIILSRMRSGESFLFCLQTFLLSAKINGGEMCVVSRKVLPPCEIPLSKPSEIWLFTFPNTKRFSHCRGDFSHTPTDENRSGKFMGRHLTKKDCIKMPSV